MNILFRNEGEGLSDKLWLSYEPHECTVELSHDKVFLDRSYNHVRLKFNMSDNIELDLIRPSEEVEDYGIIISFDLVGREGDAALAGPSATSFRRFSPENVTSV